jgi:DNA-binding CsgD family transcriptional regulator
VASSAVAGASIAFAHGDLPGVLVATERVRATGLLGVGGCPGIFNWRGMEIDALIGLGRFADAAEALEELEAAIPPSGVPSADLTLARCRGNLAGAVGEASEAGSYFARAHQLKVDVPMPFEHALVSLDDGRRLCSVENRPSAVEQLERAHRIFSDLGADPFVQACSSGLASLQVTNAPDSPSAILALSRSEMAVARLVATGLTNREVANELYVSVKTVEYHLRNSYIKLNITSRRELAALLP